MDALQEYDESDGSKDVMSNYINVQLSTLCCVFIKFQYEKNDERKEVSFLP